MIEFTCDCGKPLQAREEHAGQRTRCPDCGRELRIPAASAAIEPRPPRGQPRPARMEEEYDDREDAARRPGRTSGKAKASLILGLLSLILCIFTGVPAIICGILGLRDIGRSNGRLAGTGLAITGIVFGGVMSAVAFPGLLIGLLLPAVQKVREAANRMQSQNNLKQMVLAVHNYHDAYNCLPPAVVYDAQGKPLYSWRVLILPFIEQEALYKQFHLEEPWDSPHNKSLLEMIPRVYLNVARPNPEAGTTTYLGIGGEGTIFESNPANGLVPLKTNPKLFQAKPVLTLRDVTDGTSNTLMIAESDDAVPWSKPQDFDYSPRGGIRGRISTLHAGGFTAAFADGSVRFLPRNIPEMTLRALFTRNGGEVIPPGSF
jgi:prepilin-type processing-associated H-X9-DG protein